VFLWTYVLVYTYPLFFHFYPIYIYKVYYFILINFIIKSISFPTYFLFLFLFGRHKEYDKILFCYIKDKEIPTYIISIDIGSMVLSFIMSYTTRNNYLDTLYTTYIKKKDEREREKTIQAGQMTNESLIVHYCSARKNKVFGCLFAIIIIIILYTRDFLWREKETINPYTSAHSIYVSFYLCLSFIIPPTNTHTVQLKEKKEFLLIDVKKKNPFWVRSRNCFI